jgi:hypothetical protein
VRHRQIPVRRGAIDPHPLRLQLVHSRDPLIQGHFEVLPLLVINEGIQQFCYPILSICVNNTGISSTRSVVMVSFSVIQQAYRNFKMLSLFDRTMS